MDHMHNRTAILVAKYLGIWLLCLAGTRQCDDGRIGTAVASQKRGLNVPTLCLLAPPASTRLLFSCITSARLVLGLPAQAREGGGGALGSFSIFVE
ncbi:hypothetical protein F4809DRAFT_187174 [Biscogniauxia mediterranea]|nr:hypothetical protein F4809DRAFT_187174 [Biscogniauxia mediterranea]